MKKKNSLLALCAVLIALCSVAEAQQSKVHRIGVLLPGDAWNETVDGLRNGLRELGLEEEKQFVLAIRDTKGDVKVAEEAARNLEQEKVDLIYTTSTSVTLAARRATTDIPIVFGAGSDPVALGLVESFAKTGGRLTGVYNPTTDLTAKRLEILKEILPKLRRVLSSTTLAVLSASNPLSWRGGLLREWVSSLSSGMSFPSRSFRRVYERLGPGKWMRTLQCRTLERLTRLN